MVDPEMKPEKKNGYHQLIMKNTAYNNDIQTLFRLSFLKANWGCTNEWEILL